VTDLITIDFETFYDTGYGLNRLTTEEYINDPRFQVIGMGIKINDGETKFYVGEEQASKVLASINWKESLLLCHNTMFDGAILKWHFGFTPSAYLDTLCLARALHGVDAGGSLKALAERYRLGEKGTEVLDAKGKRLEDFQEYQLKQYGAYCKNDVKLTYDLFNILEKKFKASREWMLIDATLRMFIEPKLKLNRELLQQRLIEIKEEKSNMLSSLQTQLNVDSEEEVRRVLASNQQFAKLLEEHGVAVPMKESPRTGKDTFALSKNDEGFLALCEHEDPFIQELCAVRLGTKSTIEESRIERLYK